VPFLRKCEFYQLVIHFGSGTSQILNDFFSDPDSAKFSYPTGYGSTTLTKRAGSGSVSVFRCTVQGSRSVSKCHGSGKLVFRPLGVIRVLSYVHLKAETESSGVAVPTTSKFFFKCKG